MIRPTRPLICTVFTNLEASDQRVETVYGSGVARLFDHAPMVVVEFKDHDNDFVLVVFVERVKNAL